VAQVLFIVVFADKIVVPVTLFDCFVEMFPVIFAKLLVGERSVTQGTAFPQFLATVGF